MKEENFSVLTSESDLVRTLYQTLEWAGKCASQAGNAMNLRDYTLARFFSQLEQEACDQAKQARKLLQQHTGLLWDP